MTIEHTAWILMILAIATSLVAGVFLTFSDFVMKSLSAADAAAGTEVMQVINRKVYNSAFLIVLIGLVPISVGVGCLAVFLTSGVIATSLVIGGVLYFFGVFLTTVLGNIPMNRALDSMPLGGPDAQAYWPAYATGWTRWNHVRWISATGTAACYMIAAVSLGQAV